MPDKIFQKNLASKMNLIKVMLPVTSSEDDVRTTDDNFTTANN